MDDPCGLLERRRRLARLAGRLCPLCQKRGLVARLDFNGHHLLCPSLYVHSWSNPDAAEAEIIEPKPCTASEMQGFRDSYNAAEEAEGILFQANLERAVGDWLPPEARQD